MLPAAALILILAITSFFKLVGSEVLDLPDHCDAESLIGCLDGTPGRVVDKNDVRQWMPNARRNQRARPSE